jgi:hypothetical protein
VAAAVVATYDRLITFSGAADRDGHAGSRWDQQVAGRSVSGNSTGDRPEPSDDLFNVAAAIA